MATNKVFESGKVLSVAVASTVESGAPVLIGSMAGVALTDYNSTTGESTIDFGGVYDLSVKAIDNAGNSAVAVGDPIYYVTGDTPVLSKKASGIFFGYALEAVDSAATATINVKSAGGQDRVGFYGNGIFVSAETTGTGAAQNVAHGLGTAPSAVLVAPTEFASNLAVDILEGTHTTTNVVLTVTSGAKFKVIAFK